MKQVMTNLFSKALFTMVFCLSCATFLHSQQVELEWEGDDLWATSLETADEGVRGCDPDQLEPAVPYIFILERAAPTYCKACEDRAETTCTTTHCSFFRRYESQVGEVRFGNLPPGEYRVSCMIAKAKGCMIEGSLERSIVYENQVSERVEVGEPSLPGYSSLNHGDIEMAKERLKVYPNPFQNSFTLELTASKSQSATIQITNLTGQVMNNQVVEVVDSFNQFEFFISDKIAPGIYQLSVHFEDGNVWSTKLVKAQ